MDSDGTLAFGLQVETFGEDRPPETFTRLATAAEEAGFDAVWASDHVAFPADVSSTYPGSQDGDPPKSMAAESNCYDVFQVLATIAAATEGVTVGTNICIAPLRHPVDLVKRAFTLAAFAPGVELGIGVGWLREEFDALGVHFSERGGRTDEFLALLSAAQTEGTVAFDGEYYDVPETGFHPVPAESEQRLWIGGYSGAAFRRVGQYGDGWTIIDVPPEQVSSARDRLGRAWRDFDREGEPAIAVGRTVHVGDETDEAPVHGDDDDDHCLTGDGQVIRETIQRYQTAGTTHFIVKPAGETVADMSAQIRRFGETVIPAVNG